MDVQCRYSSVKSLHRFSLRILFTDDLRGAFPESEVQIEVIARSSVQEFSMNLHLSFLSRFFRFQDMLKGSRDLIQET